MPLPDSRFIESPSLQNYFVNKTDGSPLSAGVVTWYRDVARTTLKPIYQQVQLPDNTYDFVELNNPITLSSVGTFQDDNGNDINVYTFPYTNLPTDEDPGPIDLYYITVYDAIPPIGTSSLQFTREAWPPGVTQSESPVDTFEGSENAIANPQFAQVSFTPNSTTNNYVFTVTGTDTVTKVAPDWDLVSSGSGTITVNWLAVTNVNIPTNPPYVLDISSTGLTSLRLRQRLANSPRLFANGYINGSFVAATVGASATLLTLNYIQSNGSTREIVSDSTTATGTFKVIEDTIPVFAPPAINPNSATTGYCELSLDIPIGKRIQVSSFQLVSVQNADSSTPFLQESTARQIDHLFHYYYNSIIMQPKDSLLVGWNFGLNPWQFRATTISNVANNTYTADQTIVVQQKYVTSGTGNNIAVGEGNAAANYAFQVNAVTATNQFALIQYLDSFSIISYWGSKVSALINVDLATVNSSTCKFKMRLIYRTTLPATVSQTEPIASWASTGDPVFSAGWTAITPLNDPTFTITSTNQNFAFNQFQLPAASTDTMCLGAVVYTISDLSITGTPDRIRFYTVSLVPNDFAIDATVQTFDETLRQCQYYYEKSYNVGVLPGATGVTANPGLQVFAQTFGQLGQATVYFDQAAFQIQFKQTKRTDTPTLTFYTYTTGVAGSVDAFLWGLDTAGVKPGTDVGTTLVVANLWTGRLGRDNASYFPTRTAFTAPSYFLTATLGTFTDATSFLEFHYTSDARLGR